MTKSKSPPTAQTEAERDAARGYTDADLAEVMDHPEATDEQLAQARPFSEVFPEMAASVRRGRGPQKAPTKLPVTLRLEKEVVEAFKASGKGWQTRMGEALKKAAGL